MIYFIGVLPAFFFLSVRKRLGFKKALRQWASAFRISRADAIVENMVAQVLLGSVAYVLLTLLLFVILSTTAQGTGAVEKLCKNLALQWPCPELPMILSLLSVGIPVILFVGIFIHNTQGMIVGAYSPLLILVPYFCLHPLSLEDFGVYFIINFASYLLGWAATGVFHPKRRLGYYLSHFRLASSAAVSTVDALTIKDGIAKICRGIYGEKMYESVCIPRNAQVMVKGTSYIAEFSFEFQYKYNSNILEMAAAVKPLTDAPEKTLCVDRVLEIPFILYPSSCSGGAYDERSPNHRRDYFFKEGHLYTMDQSDKRLKPVALDVSEEKINQPDKPSSAGVTLLRVTATNSLNAFFYTLGKMVTRVEFSMRDSKGLQVLIYSYEDSPGLRWPTYRLSIVANRIHQEVQTFLKSTSKLSGQSTHGSTPIIVQYPNMSVGLACFGARHLPVGRVKLRFNRGIEWLHHLAEASMQEETKLEHVRRSIITKTIAFLSIIGGELFMLFLGIFK
jgi:hypothetical protein